jgi:carbon storage regulator CsrA
MLVLTRKYQEKIRIGENITITILRMKGKAVRLGIEAPPDISVIRGELAFDQRSNGEAEPEADETLEIEAIGQDSARSGRSFARATSLKSKWSTESRPTSPVESNGREPAPSVGFSRVTRDEVSKLLPKLVAGPAPLRSMMNGR